MLGLCRIDAKHRLLRRRSPLRLGGCGISLSLGTLSQCLETMREEDR